MSFIETLQGYRLWQFPGEEQQWEVWAGCLGEEERKRVNRGFRNRESSIWGEAGLRGQWRSSRQTKKEQAQRITEVAGEVRSAGAQVTLKQGRTKHLHGDKNNKHAKFMVRDTKMLQLPEQSQIEKGSRRVWDGFKYWLDQRCGTAENNRWKRWGWRAGVAGWRMEAGQTDVTLVKCLCVIPAHSTPHKSFVIFSVSYSICEKDLKKKKSTNLRI